MIQYLYSLRQKNYMPFEKTKFTTYVRPYLFCYGLVGLSAFSWGILHEPVLAMACGAAAISGGISRFLHLKRHYHILFPENMLICPAFIVKTTGDIIRFNDFAKEYIGLYGTHLQDLLLHDGFDEGACFRLLHHTQKQILKKIDLCYTAQKLEGEEGLFLVARLQRGEMTQNIVTDSQENTSFNIEKLKSILAKQAGTVQFTTSADNPLADVKAQLQDYLRQDKNLQNFLIDKGDKASRAFIAQADIPIEDVLFIDTDSGVPDVHFRVMMRADTGQKQTQAIVFPVISKAMASNSAQSPQNTPDMYQNIFQELSYPMALLQEDGLISHQNERFLDVLKHDKHDNLFKIFPEIYHDKIKQAIKQQATLEVNNLEQHVRLGFKKIPQLGYYLCDILDLTQEKQMETRLNQVQKMQAVGQLAGGVAHDFNNLLTAILGHCELLLTRTSPRDASFSDLTQIQNNAQRAGKLVKQLLAFSRQQTLQMQVVHLPDIIPDTHELLKRLLGENIKIVTHYGDHVSPIKIDVTQFEQIIINLAVNARDAMQAGGTLTIAMENISYDAAKHIGYDIMPAADYVGISVSDTGIGMPPDIAQKIFEPFFTTKEIGQGTGLGLSTVYGIVKQSQGFIFVESVLGQGTCFKIYFPVAEEKHTLLSKSPENLREQVAHPIEAHTKTILIAEDESSVREFVVRALQMKGYHILQADCGEEALEIFKQHHDQIDLILSDVMMPGLDGPSWVKQALENRNRDYHLIFMSGYAEDTFRNDPNLHAMGLSAKFLEKPFSLKILHQMIKDIFSQ